MNSSETDVSVFAFRSEHDPQAPPSPEPPPTPFRITRGRVVTTPSRVVVHVWYEACAEVTHGD